MYAYIKGEVTAIGADYSVIEASGIGYLINCSSKTLNKISVGEGAKLYTHLHLAEDIMALYGFYDDTERVMFRRLIAISRVGPKLALSVLSELAPADVAAAVVTDNESAFLRVPGLGKKTAQRLLLELKSVIGADQMISVGLPSSAAVQPDIRAEAVAALVALGYDGVTASRAVSRIEQADEVETLITAALRGLARN